MHVLVTDVTLESISENKKLKPVLQSYHMFGKSSSIKLIVSIAILEIQSDLKIMTKPSIFSIDWSKRIGLFHKFQVILILSH